MLRRFLILFLFAALPVSAAEDVVELGDDGLYKAPWLQITFKDMTEDLADANAQGKRLMILFEQRGCIYCKKMHEEIFPDPDVAKIIKEKYFIVQMNLFGDEPVTDFDGVTLPEKEMARRWGIVFTPTMLFLPDTAPETGTASEAAVMTMPGAFGKWTTLNMFKWVVLKGYETEEHFQKFHARMLAERKASTD
jgi:thioredoxin-related protein